MNAKITKYIIAALILLSIVLGFVYANYEGNKPTIEEQCKSGSLDACNQVIKEKQNEYYILDQQIKSVSSGAEEARSVIRQQLSGTFI